ncbi:MAG: type I-MYXAN CRISPR-associated protein Cas5/Cmx5/DevS [Planctomycetaceae bacterium]|nr:type I-MYXAN CRISPR-associated protein Cas5/Cmx5/DevS [Planctomycetaceae bacterium]
MSESDTLLMRIEVPICAFRPFASREYQNTYPVPTPASIYGMLLSFLGVQRENKSQHAGVQMAIAVTPSRGEATALGDALPYRSNVFRKLRRVSQYGYNRVKQEGAATLNQFVVAQRRPDYQDLLTDVVLWIWLTPGNDQSAPTLPVALSSALNDPSTIHYRHGGLSLGESSYLVNRINAVNSDRLPAKVVALWPRKDGYYSLPVWTDHKNDHSHSLRFELALTSPDPPYWFTVGPRMTKTDDS